MQYELYHWGVKGMKWGVRRYQNSDGSLTPAGKKRYYDTPELNKQKAAMKLAKTKRSEAYDRLNKASDRRSIIPTESNKRDYAKAHAEYLEADLSYRTAKLKYKTNKEVARINDKNVEFDSKSKHRLKLEDRYKKLGMTDEQAQAAANNQIRTEKILAASAALTVGACVAYVAVKGRKNKIDGVIKAGEALQRIEMQDTGGKLHDVFYVAQGEKDMRRYERLLGFARKQDVGKAYMMKLEAQNDVKVASIDRCRKTFRDLYDNDAEFKQLVNGRVPAISGLNKKKQYDYYNRALVNLHGSDASKKFYDKLKSQGYGAIQDINDMKFSGYHAKNPLIVFDNSKKSIMVKSVSEMKDPSMKLASRELMKATAETLGEDFLKKAGPLSAAALTATAAKTYRSDPSKQYDNNRGGASKWS